MYFFSNTIPITSSQIVAAEKHFNVQLPTSLKTIILEHNGASVECESGRMSALISFSERNLGMYMTDICCHRDTSLLATTVPKAVILSQQTKMRE